MNPGDLVTYAPGQDAYGGGLVGVVIEEGEYYAGTNNMSEEGRLSPPGFVHVRFPGATDLLGHKGDLDRGPALCFQPYENPSFGEACEPSPATGTINVNVLVTFQIESEGTYA